MPKRTLNGHKDAVTTGHFKAEPDAHDYPSAAAYLDLILGPARAGATLASIRESPVVHKQAKDLLRASRLPLLRVDNVHVASDLAKVRNSEQLSPVLLVRGILYRYVPLTVADGYHRICASYHLDEDAEIPCQIGDVTKG